MNTNSSSTNIPLIAIVGETASGKSSIAQEVGKRFSAEIINADSRMIYQGMDIGTAKPTQSERAEVPHHLLDIVKPGDDFSVAKYQRLARKAIKDITSRGNIPILVGGSGLYVDSVVFNFSFREKPNLELRDKLNSLSIDELLTVAKDKGLTIPDSVTSNKRYLIRAIESNRAVSPKDNQIGKHTYIVGVKLKRQHLRERIEKRVDTMFRLGLVKEVKALSEKYGWDNEALSAIGYKEFKPYFDDQISLRKVKRDIIKNTLNLAKRQRTWFKRNPKIEWYEDHTQTSDRINNILANYGFFYDKE